MTFVTVSRSSTSARARADDVIRGYTLANDTDFSFGHTVSRRGDKVEHCRVISSITRHTARISLSIGSPNGKVSDWEFGDLPGITWMTYEKDSSNFPDDKYVIAVLTSMLPSKYTQNVIGTTMGGGIILAALDEAEVFEVSKSNSMRVIVLAGCDLEFKPNEFDYLLPFVDRVEVKNPIWVGNSVSPKLICHP